MSRIDDFSFQFRGPAGISARIAEIRARAGLPEVGSFQASLDKQNATDGKPSPLQGDIAGAAGQGFVPMDPFSENVHGPANALRIRSLIPQIAKEMDLDPKLLEAVVEQESSFDPMAISKAGAMGLMQLMPETAHDLGVTDPFNPEQNLRGGATYLKQMLTKYGNVDLALAAYNAGPGRVDRAGGIPDLAETKEYVQKIKARLAAQGPLSGALGAQDLR